jgi:hypothetical protein
MGCWLLCKIAYDEGFTTRSYVAQFVYGIIGILLINVSKKPQQQYSGKSI